MFKVFAARSLLYGQRLQAKFPDFPHGVWARAYALCLIGRPAVAERCLNDGASVTAATGARLRTDAATARRLARERIAHADTTDSLATLLIWQGTRNRADDDSRYRSIAQLLEREPECLHAMFAMSHISSLGARARAESTFERLSAVALRRLPEVTSLPTSVSELLDAEQLSSAAGYSRLVAELKLRGSGGMPTNPH
jgi:hypothetical protein